MKVHGAMSKLKASGGASWCVSGADGSAEGEQGLRGVTLLVATWVAEETVVEGIRDGFAGSFLKFIQAIGFGDIGCNGGHG